MEVTGTAGAAGGRGRRVPRTARPAAAGRGAGLGPEDTAGIGLPCGSEEELQAQWAAYLGAALPSGALHHHSPNEGRRGWRAQRALKSGGTLAGMPDSMVLWDGRTFFLELKLPGKKPTARQAACHADLRAAGFPVAVGTTLHDLAAHLSGWGVPLRVSVDGFLRPRVPSRASSTPRAWTSAEFRASGLAAGAARGGKR
jgi:hypothetical protein